jgi:hypothetical protein
VKTPRTSNRSAGAQAHLLAALETILGERFTTVRPLGVPSAGDAYEYGFPVPERDETAAEGTVD